MSRPKIGIALGSGIARGWAHIGVIKALVKADIPTDIVSGTSIGALVGGCHLAGKLEPLEEFARSLSRRRLLSLLDFRFRASGLIGDSKLEALLRKHLGDMRIETLDRIFVSVATELATGHEIWLREGSLVQALRASYALPGVFAPVPIDGRWLIDGAIVNPVPVSATRAFGARLVIAVNLNTDPFDIAARRHREGGQFPLYVSQTPPTDYSLGGDMDELADETEDAMITAEGNNSSNEGAFLSRIRTTLSRLRGPRRSPEREVLKRAIGGKTRGPGFASVLLASLNIVQDRLARARLASDPPDIVIAPKIGEFNLLEFDRADDLIRLGETAAEEAIPEICDAMERLR